MSSLNKVQLIGNLGKDPEIRSLPGGGQVCNFSIATSDSWKDKATGERKSITEWHNIVIWNEHLIKIAENYLKKGQSVYIEGSLKTRKWTDRDGNDKYTTEVVLAKFKGDIVMLGSKEREGSGDYGGGGRSRDDYSSDFSTGGGNRPSQPRETYDLNDDIPF